LLLQLARQQTAEYQIQSTLAKQLATQLAGQGVRVKGSGGLQVTRAGGYIPAATRMAETVGAQAGGYAPGKVVKSPVGGVMNTAEDVKYVPGFAQPFINPPAGSKAGRTHRQNSISRTGVDPYMNSGFIPNFAYKNFGFKNNELNLNNQSIRDFSDPAYFEKRNLADGGLSINGKPNNVYDSVSGVIQRIPFVNKKKLNSLAEKYFPAYLKDESIPVVVKDSYDRAFNKIKTAGFYAQNGVNKSDVKKQMLSKFNAKNKGDFYNFRGALYESMVAKKVGSEYKLSSSEYSRSDLVPVDATIADLFTGIETKSGATGGNFKILQKAIETAIKGKQLNQDKSEDIPIGKYGVYQTYNDGFIPNFAPPTSAIRIPWFKKFGNAAFDKIQPTLGISKASDIDTFRQIGFRSTAKGADENGDPNIFGPLYETFSRKALQLINKSNIFGEFVRGSVLQPRAKSSQTAFDDALLQDDGIIGLDFKGFPKKNLSGGSVAKHMNDKLKRVAQTDPEQAAKIKEGVMVFNEPGHENQLPSEFGKNFLELAGTSYSQILKNSPDLVKGLSAETNSLLNNYVKNPEFLAMNAAKGFIPNFAYKQAVMGLEESMSGEKAVFDTKPFPHIRNKSQPTFSSAISDHGGLSNALSDSMRGQKDAGLISKGYVPNFAKGNKGKKNQPRNTQSSSNAVEVESYIENYAKEALRDIKGTYKSTIDKIKSMFSKVDSSVSSVGIDAVKSLRERTFKQSRNAPEKNAPKSTFSENLSKAGTAIAIAGPMIAGLVEQTVFANKKRTDMSATERSVQSGLSTGLSAISTGAGIGASFGLPGVILGSAVGSLVALKSALDAATLSTEELSSLNQEQAQKTQASISAASSYIEAQKSLSEMIMNGASSNDIENATKKLSSGFNEIADVKLQEIFNSTGGNIAEMTKRLQEYTNVTTSQSAFKQAITGQGTAAEISRGLSVGLTTEDQKVNFLDIQNQFANKYNKMIEELDLAGGSYGMEDYVKNTVSKSLEKQIDSIFTAKGISKTDKDYPDQLAALLNFFLKDNFNQIASDLQKNKLATGVQKEINDFRQIATKSFGEIFRKIERDLNKNLFDIALSFEKDSSTRRIQSSILDFSTNFQDSINSFISSNLPDARKFDFTAANAGQKAQMLLQKSQQDYDKAIAEQDNEKSNFLTKNAQELSGSFKSSLSNSQVNAEFYKNKVLPQIQSGNYSGDVNAIISGLKEAQLNKLKETRSSADMALSNEGFSFGSPEEIKNTLKDLAEFLQNPGLEEDKRSKIIAYQQELINSQETTLKFANQSEQDKLSAILTEKAEAQTLFEQKQANAKKELENKV
jgi:hypothetical protein